MSFLSLFAIYFVVWWVILFAVLPVGVTAHDSSDPTLGATRGSAPDRPRMGYKVLLTTGIAAIVVAAFWLVTDVAGFTVDDIPRIVPEFSRPTG